VRPLHHATALLSLLILLAACDFGPVADTSELTAMVSTITALEEGDFTPASWNAISQALALPQRTPAEIAAKLAALDEALTGLEFAGQAALEAAIAATNDLAEEDYTPESWAALADALALPEASNAEVLTKTAAIATAISNLSFLGQAPLEEALDVVEALVEEDYTTESWSALEAALELPESTNEEAIVKANAIEAAIAGLQFAAQGALDEAIAAAEALTESDYSPESWSNLQAALALPVTTNAEVVAKTSAITDAIDALILAAKANLDKAKADAGALNESDYVSKAWGALQNALALPESDNADLIAKTDAINDAIDKLVFAGQAALDAALSAADALFQDAYTSATWDDLQAALALPETSNTEVVNKTAAINLAINNLAFDVPPASYVATGSLHTCSLNAGQVYCWGNGTLGALGNGINAFIVPAATRVSDGAMGNSEVNSIALGMTHTCALKAGEVYCWGDNFNGQLGDGTSKNERFVPVKVSDTDGVFSNSDVTAIAAGGYHTCAIKAGEVYCWGDNFFGQLGDGTSGTGTNKVLPVKVSDTDGVFSNSDVTAIAAGNLHTCAIKAESVYCWGHNGDGELDLLPLFSNDLSNVPVAINLDSVSVTDIASHSTAAETCALGNGSVYCWGRNSVGIAPPTKAPAGAIPSETDITAISVGFHAVCALNAGSVYCWGGKAEVGDSSADLNAPVKVANGEVFVNSNVTAIAAGSFVACAIKNFETYCWGSTSFSNNLGQLGSGDTSEKPIPNKVVFAP
jgi:alpha-tubulin suppressor-like RCC1 family protein